MAMVILKYLPNRYIHSTFELLGKSWWKNLGENSRDVIELLEENKVVEPNNIIEELDIEIIR